MPEQDPTPVQMRAVFQAMRDMPEALAAIVRASGLPEEDVLGILDGLIREQEERIS